MSQIQKRIQKLVINFLPIVLIFLLATYTPQFAAFSQTALGRLLAIFLILFYLKLDFLTGLFVCVLIILYYQTDYVEGFSEMLKEDEQSEQSEQVENAGSGSGNGSDSGSTANLPTEVPPASEPRTEPLEPFSTYESVAVDNNTILYDKSKQEFRKKYCDKGHLVHKGEIVNTEMAEHIFGEIKHDDYHKCNICDPSCKFELIEPHIRSEDDLRKPVFSKEI
jgi:hypothetical protein